MEYRDDRADCERQLKTERNKNEDAENAKGQCPKRCLSQLTANQRTHTLRAFDLKLGLRQSLNHLLFNRFARIHGAANSDVVLTGLRGLLNQRLAEINGFQTLAHVVNGNW